MGGAQSHELENEATSITHQTKASEHDAALLAAHGAEKPTDTSPVIQESSDEEVESFEEWASGDGSKRSSIETVRSPGKTSSGACSNSSSAATRPGGTDGGDPHRTSDGVASSSNDGSGWLDQRPSADTPFGFPPAALDGKRVSASLERPRGTSAASQRYSDDSVTNIASARSSFALERASTEANRASLDAFKAAAQPQPQPQPHHQQQHEDSAAKGLPGMNEGAMSLDSLVSLLGLTDDLKSRVASLAVLQPQTPAPTSMLARLWRCAEDDVAAPLQALAARGIINVAGLPDRRVWCLPPPQCLDLIRTTCRGMEQKFHASLIDAYTNGGALPVQSIPDDGYFHANAVHHLLAAGRAADARSLLLDLGWLAGRLATGGASAVVADFRRCLAGGGDAELKLVLDAVQMSLAQAQEHPEAIGLLRALVVGRLMTAPASSEFKSWLASQQRAMAEDTAAAARRGAPCALAPLTPSLDQAGGLQRLALRGHRGAVTCLALTPSGTEAISGGADGNARMWDLQIGDCILSMEGHTGPITSMDITADGSLLLTASEDATVRAHELERGQCLRVLAGHAGTVTGVVTDPGGRFVATCSADGTARVWELSSARAVYVLQTGSPPRQGGVGCLALSPCTGFLILGCGDGSVQLFNVTNGHCIGSLVGHTAWVSSVAFAPSGKHAISASHDGTARVWSLTEGRCLHVLKGHHGRVNTAAVSANGKTVATGGDDGECRVWSLKSGTCTRVLKGHSSFVCDVTLAASGERIATASGDGTVVVFGGITGEILRVLEGHSGAVNRVVLTEKARFAVTAGEDGAVRAWDLAAPTGHAVRWHEGTIRTLAARDGIVLATTGDDCVARLWQSSSGEYLGVLRGHEAPIRWATFSTDGQRLVTASPDRMVCTWDCVSGKRLREMPVHRGSRLKSFATCGDLSLAVLCLFDGTVTVHDLETGEQTVSIIKWGQRDAQLGHTSAVNQVLMTPDGELVLTLSKDGTSRCWSSSSGDCLRVLSGHTDAVCSGSLDARGSLLATFSLDNSVRLWTLDSGLCKAVFPLTAEVACTKLSPLGMRLAVAYADWSVDIFSLDAENLQPTRLNGHSGDVTGLAFSADDTILASCSSDCCCIVWDSTSGERRGVFSGDCALTSCHLDSVSERLVLGTSRGEVHFLRAEV